MVLATLLLAVDGGKDSSRPQPEAELIDTRKRKHRGWLLASRAEAVPKKGESFTFAKNVFRLPDAR